MISFWLLSCLTQVPPAARNNGNGEYCVKVSWQHRPKRAFCENGSSCDIQINRIDPSCFCAFFSLIRKNNCCHYQLSLTEGDKILFSKEKNIYMLSMCFLHDKTYWACCMVTISAPCTPAFNMHVMTLIMFTCFTTAILDSDILH